MHFSVAKSWVFGAMLLAALPAQTPAPPAPTSSLPITLMGVFVEAKAPRDSKSLVQCAGSADGVLVKIGDKVCGVAELIDIKENGVLIKNLSTSREERLPLKTSGGAPPAPVSPRPTEPELRVVNSPAGATVEMPLDLVHHYMLNLQEILTSALAVPHYRDDAAGRQVMDGFELREIKPGSVVEKVGLKNGDVITEVNGEKLDGLPTVMRVANQIQTVEQSTMIVIRNGKALTFKFNRR